MIKDCSECLNDEAKFYCCCLQIFLCVNCLLPHKNHLILEKNMKFDRLDEITTLVSYLQVFNQLEIEINELKTSSSPETISIRLKQRIELFENHLKSLTD